MTITNLEDILHAAEMHGDQEGWEPQVDDLIAVISALWERCPHASLAEVIAAQNAHFNEVLPGVTDAQLRA